MGKKIYISEGQLRGLLYGLTEGVNGGRFDSSYIRDNIESNRKMVNGIVFISYGTDRYDVSKVREIKLGNDNRFVSVYNKPGGGIWGSPVDAKNGWADFIERDDWNLRSLSKHYRFRLNRDAKIYVIDSLDDLLAVSSRYARYDSYDGVNVYGIDFEALSWIGCDGVYITDRASIEFHETEIYLKDRLGFNVSGLGAWDVCSICVFNPNVILPIEENAFEKASFPKRGLEVDDDMLDDVWRPENAVQDRYWLQMQSDYEKYGNQNVRSDSSELFGGKHPGIMSQGHGNSKETQLARRYNGTIKSGLR